MRKQELIKNYILGLRKPAKREYAMKYADFVNGEPEATTGKKYGDPPNHPGIGYMAAQAVRMTINAIRERKEP